MNNRIALIIGSTGLIGKNIVTLLTENEQYDKIISITRRPLGISHPKLSEVITNFENLTTLELSTDIDVAFCCLGTTMKQAGSKEAFYKVDHTFIIDFFKLAKRYNVKNSLVVSSMGADKHSFIYYNKVKGETEYALMNLGLPVLNIFQPSLLIGNREESRFGEDLGKVFNQFLSPIIPKKYKGIEGITVAKAMISQAALIPSKKVSFFTSDQIQELGK
ncbi:NAD-dependent epimerase/dehydratase family protein [Flammeovirga pectinis]|uniref:NAD-dependent epimerase/dehydratase family protein n=1 Tax=Flammeovirga pectinis TaxID=2494373 RepID=A0A3S9P5R6_9BACT|nr:NAD-dependent epimerase/dehydratase family protein [Flammeovirga pectinis]AZQ63518.1 NAD-dependent epimerase/dehydratase family protein [Flammeovirga pectinis]